MLVSKARARFTE